MCLLWACACNFTIREISPFSFQELVISCSPGVCLWYFRFSGTAVSCWAPFFPSCPKHPNMPVPYQFFESGETKTSPFGSSPQKLKCWIYIPLFSFPPKGEAVSWAFSLYCTELYWLRGRATEMKCSGFSYPFHCACSWLYAHLGCSPGDLRLPRWFLELS